MISESRAALHLCTCGNRATTDDGGGDVATTAAAGTAAVAMPPLSDQSAICHRCRRRHCATAAPPPQLAAAAHMQCSIMSPPYVASIQSTGVLPGAALSLACLAFYQYSLWCVLCFRRVVCGGSFGASLVMRPQLIAVCLRRRHSKRRLTRLQKHKRLLHNGVKKFVKSHLDLYT